MAERFLRARTRLSKHEKRLLKEREIKRRLNLVPDDETVKVPIIGEWDLSNPPEEAHAVIDVKQAPIKRPPVVSAKYKIRTNRQIRPFPRDIPLSRDQKKRSMKPEFELITEVREARAKTPVDPPFRFKTPMASGTVQTIQRVNFPPGTTTTNLTEIIASKHRVPAKVLPPLKQTEDVEVINFFPLEVFDDATYEEFSLEYLMQHPDAWSKYLENGVPVWKKCVVLEHDPTSGYFLIERCEDKKRKQVARFNLRFDIESVEKFERRINAAKEAARRYEMQYRFDARVQGMPMDDLPDLSPNSLERIVAMMNTRRNPKYQPLVNDLIEEVCDNFRTMNNRFQFEYDIVHNGLIPDREEFMQLFPKPKPVPYCALAFTDRYTYLHGLKRLSTIHLKSVKHLLEALQAIWGILINRESLLLLNGPFKELLRLEEYVERQEKLLTSTTSMFKKAIQEALESAISATVYDEAVASQAQGERARFKRMVILTARMMHTFLFDITGHTLAEFSSLFTDNEQPPQFSIDLDFQNSNLCLVPSPEEFKESVLTLLVHMDERVTDLSSIRLPLHDVNMGVVSFADCIAQILEAKSKLSKTIDGLIENVLDKFLDEYSHLAECLALDPPVFTKEFDPLGQRSLDDYHEQITKFLSVLETVQHNMNHKYFFSIFQINCEDFKRNGTEHAQELISAMLTQMKTLAISSLNALQNEFDKIFERMKIVPKTPEELGALKTFIADTVKATGDREEKIKKILERFTFLEGYKFEISNDECQYKYEVLQMPNKLLLTIDETERKMQVEKSVMIRELRQNQRKLETDSLLVTELIPAFVTKYQELDMTVDAYDEVVSIDQQLSELRERQEKYCSHERLFEFDPSPCSILTKLVEEFTPLKNLWTLASQWQSNSTTWLDSQFSNTKPDQMNSFIIQATKQINKLKKDLTAHYPVLAEKVLKPLIEQIEKFKSKIPLVAKLRHPGIKTKHWEQISDVVEFKVTPIDHTLEEFLAYDLGRWAEPIIEIANVAANEYNIESSLDQMDNELQAMQFVTVQYKETDRFILSEVDDVVSLIDDQLVTTQTLLTSPFIAPVKKRAVERLAFLRLCHDILDQWVECQRGWLYLQPIFTGTSIQQKLHREARDWNTVDRTWEAIMSLTHKHPDFTNVMHRNGLLDDLKLANKLLESITTGLNAYLESKRHGFPRFFFLSNDELIAILSHTKDFNQIQKSMSKLFEYVQTITVDEEMMITAMNDDGLESVPLNNPIDGDTPEIEDWLNAFEEEMKVTLRTSIQKALEAYAGTSREKWISKFPAQVVLISNQIVWTSEVTKALKTSTLRQIKLLQQRYVEQLEQMTTIVRQNLTPSLRQAIQCILINEVHNRDIIQNIIRQEVTNVDSFKWQVQLRYYWEDDTVIVRSINNVYEYSYEYAGNSARLVITPLTDRCYQTLLSSFKQNMSGAPSGPAGTGKTETVRDCAKALGRPCVVYNCSEEVTPEQMSQFFAGLSSSGSWSCFDEFNRINIEVLSVIAQQVRTIQNAIAANVDTFVLDSRTLKLNVNAAICITMNPGYAGRTELPDNLKALFRPCAMMVPDFAFIAEILLFSGGFKEASVLSVKLVALFDLCRTQLSKAHHYDWGMRAMKSILTTASKAKRDDLERPEAILLVESIQNCTRPRLVSADILLFDNICHDVFPDVLTQNELPEDMKGYLSQAFKELGAIDMPVFMSKTFELYETSLVRHGVMLVGGPMGGKTTCWRALEKARKMCADNGKGWRIHVDVLNPKAISIPELYGLFDPISSGWSDGVLSSKIRDCSMSDPTEFKWIIVDGPVDSLWIETMNSLLDDNKVLCLSNNERISLGSHVKMVFEVDDLSQASPATVSRCGMVYFDPSVLDWKAIADAYVLSTTHEFQIIMRKHMDEHIPALIDFIRTSQHVVIGSNPLFLMKNMIRLIRTFFDLLRQPKYVPGEEGEEQKEIDVLNHDLYFSPMKSHEGQRIGYFTDYSNLASRVFAFSCIWAFGGVLDEDGRTQFDEFIRHRFEFLPNIPNRTVFDFYMNPATLKFEEWTDGKTGFNLTEDKAIEQQLVPTNQSTAVLYISRLLAHHETHMLFHGPESGKTLCLRTLMENVLEKRFDCRYLPMANCSTSSNVLKVLRSFLQRSHGCYGPLDNQKLVVFLDNLGAVKPEQYGAQPPLELIRQFFDYGGWYDTSKIEFQRVVGVTLAGAMGCAGGGLYSIPERLLRHFFFIHCPKYATSDITYIVGQLLVNRLHDYASPVKEIIGTIAKASTSVFEQCKAKLLPIPGKSHYLFSLRSIVRVLKGIILCPAGEVSTRGQFITLWYHEMMREFHDRFNSKEDRDWFKSVMNQSLDTLFKFEDKKSCENAIFTEFFESTSVYHQCKLSINEILSFCNNVLEDHNKDAMKSLDIVLFAEAVTHISALTRVLSMPRGHAMLVGVKSSGRKSLASLALHMASMEPFEIKITRTYGFSEWRDDMKALMKQCGVSDLPTGFVLSDVQIIGSFQLEDISNLLTNGEIPNLYERDEMEQLKADIVQAELLVDEDPWELFRNRVKQHLHLILVFSPFGSVFRESVLSYPALRTETTIDWYMPWSRDALESVAAASLSKLELGDKAVVDSVVSVCVKIHKSVEDAAVSFLKEQKRFTACTPSRYFELLATFARRLKENQKTNRETIQNYVNGVDKITTTRHQIEGLSQQLDRDIPMLQQKRAEVEKMLVDLQAKQAEVEETKAEVKEQSELAEIEANAAAETNRIAQEQLAAAQPILQAAQQAVDSMDKDSLVNIKTLKKIHPALRETFDAICIIFGRSPRRVDGDQPGTKKDDYWPETLSLLNDYQFIKKVKMFEVEKMSRETINKLKKYVGANKEEREKKLAEVQSGYQAVGNLYQWVCASYDYWFVYQEILPKKIEAEKAEAKLKQSQEILAQRRQHLQSVEDQLTRLQERVSEEERNEQNLADSVSNTQLRMRRAEQILQGLSGETKRWGECANTLQDSSKYIMGDTLLVAASLTHLGAFGPTFRAMLISKWKDFLKEVSIAYNENFTIALSLGNDPTIRDWIVKGLPNDVNSIENSIIIENSPQAYPLLIDPQLSGTKWLRAIKGENLVVLRFDQSDFLQKLRSCVTSGVPALVENVGLKLDPLIEPILSREWIVVDGQKKVALGGEYVSYSENFHLYLSTKYPNPHYSPEVCSQVTLINFTTTPTGLTDLLMNNLIEVEQEELDKMRISIMEANAENTRKLKEVENEILVIVSNAGSDILDDDKAIETLKKAQKTSADIEKQMAQSEKTEKLIANFREKFIAVAERAALLYFCAADFAVVDPMYQFSLKWFVSLFKQAIAKANHEAPELISEFDRSVATCFFESVSFSLFSKHKLLFSTLMATRILFSKKEISGNELAFILQPHHATKAKEIDFVPDDVWPLAVSLESVSPVFEGLIDSIKRDSGKWKEYLASNEPEKLKIPFDKDLTPFQKLIILRVFHLHRVREGLRIFVSETLGDEFVTPPPLNLMNVFKESSPLTPLIFIITPGIDPVDEVTDVATSLEMEKYLRYYSLGRGRGQGAEELILDSAEKGFWVMLQNCHLSLSWMPRLEFLIDNLDPRKVHDRFRLCLVTMSDDRFPIGILYQGTKLIYEIPKGIRENILRIYSGFNPDEYNNDWTIVEKQLTFHLAFFHAVVLERLQFGSIGWNIPYEFNPSDFAISKKHLKTFLAGSHEVPFEALSYVIGELNYGGRVTDKLDRRLLLSLLRRFFSEDINSPDFSFGQRYVSPEFDVDMNGIVSTVSDWPIVTEGEDVGLAMNASTITARNEALQIFNSLIEIQPTLVAAGGEISEEQFALNFVLELRKEIPEPFDVYRFTQTFDLSDTINTVLHHEIVLYNNLISVINESLERLSKGLKGLIVIDEKLDLLNKRLLANKIPEVWLVHSFPSILPLREYIDDLKMRISFMHKWIKDKKKPIIYKLGAFFHPEEFLTAVLQVYARKKKVPFDTLKWQNRFVRGTPTTPSDDGIFVQDLYMEGAKFDSEKNTLFECGQRELISVLPITELVPCEASPEPTKKTLRTFVCPIYRMQNRGTGALDLPNHIMDLQIDTDTPEHWIQRSVAVFITVQS